LKNYNTLFSFIGFAILVAIPPYILKYTSLNDLLVPGFWGIYCFVTGITFLALLLILAIQRINNEMYAQAFLGATTFKLLATLVFALVFIKKMHPDKLSFVADFVYLYFLNMGFEIYCLLRKLRNQNSR
jgi:hydrogenase-4 membrane subunit HyfE